jgi:hypothetical protein
MLFVIRKFASKGEGIVEKIGVTEVVESVGLTTLNDAVKKVAAHAGKREKKKREKNKKRKSAIIQLQPGLLKNSRCSKISFGPYFHNPTFPLPQNDSALSPASCSRRTSRKSNRTRCTPDS